MTKETKHTLAATAVCVAITVAAMFTVARKGRLILDNTRRYDMVLVSNGSKELFAIPAKQDFPPMRITATNVADVNIEVTTPNGIKYKAVWMEERP